VLAVLNHPEGTTFSARERRHLAVAEQSSSISVGHSSNNEEITSGTAGDKGGGLLFKLPPLTAIAGVLIRDWAEGRG
jgi:NAD+ diphosphatase